ncbi:MAG: hypothetical protein DMD70_02575 [Gemmatimonadetes bacterium]|nr:MAG: hypothetical protein DMD70_02575 [Gemmatimonadota bacterium]
MPGQRQHQTEPWRQCRADRGAGRGQRRAVGLLRILRTDDQQHAHVVYVSDSQYLVKGMSEWVAGWEARGWKRKGGVLENQELWQKLVQAAAAHQVEWRWIEGHAGHAKNEYADVLATRAAERQERSNGLVPSGFDTWLAQERARGRYTDYDPDQELHERL